MRGNEGPVAGFQLNNHRAEFDAEVFAFIAQGVAHRDDAGFSRLMLRGFSLQFAASSPYRSYCQSIGVTPDTIETWLHIPAVSSFPHAARLRRLYTPGTAEKIARKSRTVDLAHSRGPFFPDASLVELLGSVQIAAARRFLFPDLQRMKLLFLVPSPKMAPGMVMAAGLERFKREFGAAGSRFLISFRGLDLKGFVADLRRSEQSGEPLAILGASHGIDYFLDACLAQGVRFSLPSGSRLMDSGGFMGRYVGCTPEEFYSKCRAVFGLERSHCVNALWICESSTVYFDAGFSGSEQTGNPLCLKVPPPWSRVEIVDPLTFQPVADGETGLLRLYDLSNRGMACVVQTDKMGYRTPVGFQVVGKLDREHPLGQVDPRPSHPGGMVISRLMEFMIRKKMAGVATVDRAHPRNY